MSAERFVVLGVARVRATWFSATSNWANSAAVPLEFIKCVSAAELRARLSGGRTISAILVDGSVQGVDRDLLDIARAAGAAAVVVDDGRVPRNWIDMGAVAVLDSQFDQSALLTCLTDHATPVRSGAPRTAASATTSALDRTTLSAAQFGPLVAVTGTPGSGSSTVAMVIAQALATRPANRGAVVLADLRLTGDQTMYHHPGDVVPGLSELVDAHRRGSPGPSEVREMCWSIDERGYDLLLGLRRARDWSALRIRAVEAALDTLRLAYRAVVTDVDPDLEGEEQSGSVDVEERNVLARSATTAADVVVVVTSPSLAGLHGTVRLHHDLLGHGVAPDDIVTVVNRTRRSPRHRAEIAAVLRDLGAADSALSPVFLPDKRQQVESIHRSGGRLPLGLERLLGAAVGSAIDRSGAGRDVDPDHIDAGTLKVRRVS